MNFFRLQRYVYKLSGALSRELRVPTLQKYLRYQPPPELSCHILMCDKSPNALSVLKTKTSELFFRNVFLSGSFR